MTQNINHTSFVKFDSDSNLDKGKHKQHCDKNVGIVIKERKWDTQHTYIYMYKHKLTQHILLELVYRKSQCFFLIIFHRRYLHRYLYA